MGIGKKKTHRGYRYRFCISIGKHRRMVNLERESLEFAFMENSWSTVLEEEKREER